MPERTLYEKELDYLVRYAHMAPMYFVPLRDAAEKAAGRGSGEDEIQRVTLRLIGDMLDQGVRIGDMSSREGEDVIPWDVPRQEALDRVAREMKSYDDPIDFIDICWFTAG
ncbi:hypothetical protein [Streptomyces marokkonensis]|uniref:hypothetical protein n=1 Tax=Streptomyces marokkonensis TaxID=324855 RepID=UPI0031EC9839